jgi:hypothetical protein
VRDGEAQTDDCRCIIEHNPHLRDATGGRLINLNRGHR